jgi:hypothetical protein
VAAAAHCCSQKARSSPSRYFRSVLCLRSTGPGESQGRAAKSPPPIPCRAAPPRHPEARSATSLARAASPRAEPRGPRATAPPVCIPFADAFQRLLLTAHRSKPGFCVVGLPAIRTFQRHGPQHLLHYGSPFGFHFCFRNVPSGFVQRTGYSACGLGYPHQVWWAPPMYMHSSFLAVPGELRRFPNQMHSPLGLHGDKRRGMAPVVSGKRNITCSAMAQRLSLQFSMAGVCEKNVVGKTFA